MIEQGNRFTKLKDGVLQQLLTGKGNTIPLNKLPELSQAIELSRQTALKNSQNKLPPLRDTFILEASQVIEINDVLDPKANNLKGLLLLGSATNANKFDWVMMAAINFETWKFIDIKFNPAFGLHERSLKPDTKNSFTTLNDYMQMVGTATNRQNYAYRFAMKRVFIPQQNEAITLGKNLEQFDAYLPSASSEKSFIVDKNRAVYRIRQPQQNTAQQNTVSTQSLNALEKVGELK